MASCKIHDPPTPLKITGQRKILLLLVIVLPVDVATKLQALAPDVKVAVEPKLRLPEIEIAVLLTVPAKPVKFKSRKRPEAIVNA